MTSMVGKLTLVLVVTGLNLAVLAPTPGEAGVIHQKREQAFPTVDSNVVRIRCERSLSNLWSCNDDVRVQDRRVVQNRVHYTQHPCDHSYQTARNGSRCGNRAADKKLGGR
jgi:hypothetical protein